MPRKTQSKEVGEMFTTSIALPPEAHKRLRHLCVDEGISLREAIRQAVDEYLKRKEKGRAHGRKN